MVVRFKIFSYEDKVKLTSVLAENGYPVWVEIDEIQFVSTDITYFVYTELETEED